jgi:hypothetical protein
VSHRGDGRCPRQSAAGEAITRAVRVHVVFTLLMFALATAYPLQGEHEALGEAPLGWQRWRRQLREQTRDMVIVFAQGAYGIFHMAHMAECSMLWGEVQRCTARHWHTSGSLGQV